MTHHIRRLAAACATVSILACAGPSSAATKPLPVPSQISAAARGARAHAPVRVEGAWVRAAPPGVSMLAGYMDVHNTGATPLRLVSAQSDAFGMVELHRTELAQGMSSMHPAGAQDIPAGGTLPIRPGGFHWMLMQPRRQLKVGDTVHFILHFADGSTADIAALVRTTAP